jgi:hypothetical protein
VRFRETCLAVVVVVARVRDEVLYTFFAAPSTTREPGFRNVAKVLR